MEREQKRVAIKVGSNVLTQADGTLDLVQMRILVAQLAYLHKENVEIILISSGAVAAGRSELQNNNRKLDVVEQRQLYSTVGQVKLINHYAQFFSEYNIPIGQVLTTKTNFEGRQNYLNQRNCIRLMLENGVIPVINENDAVSVTELMFTDNDELSGLIASMINADALIILSNIDGVFTGNPADPDSKLIKQVHQGEDLSDYIQSGKSEFGRGGMKTKASIARKIADEGIDVYITNGRRQQVLIDILESDENVPSTHFIAAQRDVSSVKKWIAHSDGFAKGSVIVDDKAAELLKNSETISLLPIGITKIDGSFRQDDIIRICDKNGEIIGWGKAQYGSNEAAKCIGKKGQKPLVHYDYLYLQ